MTVLSVTRAQIRVAGEMLAIDSRIPVVSSLLRACADGTLRPSADGGGWDATGSGGDEPGVRVVVESERRPFDTRGWARLTRDSWHRDGEVILEDACTSGFDAHVSVEADVPTFVFRRRPPLETRAANTVLRSRGTLLARAVLLHFPAMWRASLRDRAPVHAPAVAAQGRNALLVGPGGVGKSTLIAREVAGGGRATGDNLSVGDGETVWGVVEPLRVEGGAGRAMPHGRRESTLAGRVPSLRPDALVVLSRGEERRIGSVDPARAGRIVEASTYAAGELRRFWGFASLLAMGTGIGPAHPPVHAVSMRFAERLPCVEVALSHVRGVRLAEVLAEAEAALWA